IDCSRRGARLSGSGRAATRALRDAEGQERRGGEGRIAARARVRAGDAQVLVSAQRRLRVDTHVARCDRPCGRSRDGIQPQRLRRAALGRAGEERRGFDLQAPRAGSAAREDEQIPRLVPRAAPAAARLAVSACSRPRARLLDPEELRRQSIRQAVIARARSSITNHRSDGRVLPMHTSSKKGKAMACRIAISFAAVAMGISCIATDASATCKFKAKKDIIVILDVGHTNKDSGQISARGVKEYDFNMNLPRRVLEELVNTGFLSTQMIVMSGSNTHESRLQRSKRANDRDADLFISIHHDGVKNETRMPWQYNGKEHWFLDKFEGFSLW